MSNQRQKATKGKALPKAPPAKQPSPRFMPFRAYKTKEPESKIPSHVRSKRQESDAKDNAQNETAVKNQPPKDGPKKPKLSKKIHANRKLSGERKRRKTKTFDISSFPRVFSTSDLMEKMSENPKADQGCTFQQASRDVENAPTDTATSEELDLQLLPTSDQLDCEKFNDLQFPSAHFMVFNNKQRRAELEEKLTQTEIDLECRNFDLKTLSNQLQEKSQDLIIKEQKEKILQQKLEQKDAAIVKLREENDVFRREKARYDKSLKDLQHNIRCLEEQLQRHSFKGHVKMSEYEKLRERIREFENEREAMIVESNKLKREIKEKTDLIDSLSRRNDHLQKQNDLLNVTKKENRIYALEFKVDALQDTVNKVKHENEKLKKTYTYTVNELAEYEMKQMKLREIIDKQKSSLKVLENCSSTENRQLQNYELDNIRLREMNRNLFTDMEKIRSENQRLVQLVTMMPSTRKEAHQMAISQQKPRDNYPPNQPRKETHPLPVQQSNPKPIAFPQPIRKETQPIAMAPPVKESQPAPSQSSNKDSQLAAVPPKEQTIMPPPRVENPSIEMPPVNHKQTPKNPDATSDRKETPQSGIPPTEENHKRATAVEINKQNSHVSMAQSHSHETPQMDQQHIAMYLVQTPGSTPQRTSKDALHEIQNFKTTIMQAFHQNHKSNG